MRQVKLLFAVGLFIKIHSASGSSISEYPSAERAEPTSIGNLASTHAKGVAYLKTVVGLTRAERILNTVGGIESGLQVVAACVGSFNKPGLSEVALGLVKSDLSQVIYVALLNDSDPKILLSQVPSTNERTVLSKFLSVRCLSWTAIERENALHGFAGEQKSIRRSSHMDSPCVAPLNSDLEYICYSYDDKKGEFFRIGAWSQE